MGLVFVGLLVGCAAFPASSGASPDASAIRRLLEEHYFRGMDALDFEVFAPAFHRDARLAFVVDGALVQLDLAAWRERLDELRADADHPLHHERSEKSIDEVQVVGDTARATVRFVFPSRTYTDFLQLVRVDGRWQILSKVFDLEVKT